MGSLYDIKKNVRNGENKIERGPTIYIAFLIKLIWKRIEIWFIHRHVPVMSRGVDPGILVKRGVGRLRPPVGPEQRPGGGPRGEAPGSS